MSAILGRVEFDGAPVDERSFRAAMTALAPKGAPAPGLNLLGNVALAWVHLPVSRREAGRSQRASAGGQHLLSDAILDDRQGLEAALGLAPAQAHAASDAELMLAAWHRWGRDSPKRIVGDFALAVWDGGPRRLHLVQDHVGTRPLYWARKGRSLVFSSSIRALVAFPDLSWSIDEEIVARFLCDPGRPLPRCFWADIHFTGPGTTLTLGAEETAEYRWWRPRDIEERDPGGQAACEEQLRALVTEAVRCRVDTDFPVASHLSGGLDSTLVTRLAAQELAKDGRSLRTYSWAPPVSAHDPDMGEGDERRLIDRMARADGLDCHFGSVRGDDLRRFISGPMELDGPSNLMEELETLQDARSREVRVILSGWGGDEALSAGGLGYLAHLLRTGQLPRAWRVLVRHARGRHPARVMKVLWRSGIAPNLPEPLARFWSPFALIHAERCFISPGLRRRHAGAVREASASFPMGHDPKDFMIRHLEYGHLGERMRTWDAWAARSQVVYRYPLTDRRLLEFILGLPATSLFGDGQFRFLATRAFRDLFTFGLSPDDPANQRNRARFKRECWEILKHELESGDLHLAESWFRAPDLGRAIRESPSGMDDANLLKFAEIYGAMRIHHLHERHKPPNR
ncbi:asparagine synthase-related protein [Roseibacterium sp. SDUM158017]|uniref:asparagine synthetase B family protein n=1 Tax=Roseicyclus salinarum TaxID=3036773 RepID=UPI0024155BFF|nr:asparagine synthase-related protein [Roseibacterium sp. SDUM158017]MDG4648524.1 asparagine synthase-related protein [Roseibacterium sp. SDUM158017]